ncbi:MAG: hypothetical protein LBE92_11305 [Chryseobacterium sp.]|jgi:hypothetical protein|uniref:hypothetical protein n=1 Tax=Chryseobacterium sp. TaxID=1871047 RepID=UPI00281AFF4D|nr:hypothetical protein [Chryseobacterium sp.]MDR2236703.1 hypothetical protein [Chryseobacterium sp.]
MILNRDIKIETGRLTLQPVEDLYTDDILEHFTQEVTRFMPFNPQGNREDIVRFVDESKRTLSNNTDLVMVALDSHRISSDAAVSIISQKNLLNLDYG